MTDLNAEQAMNESNGATQALPALLKNYAGFFAFLKRRVHTAQDAEEILQTALARTIERDPMVAEEKVSAWFYRVLRNAVADHYRRQSSEARAVERWHNDQIRTAKDDRLQRTPCACLGELIPTLKPEYAELLTRVELRGESVQAAAKSLDVTPNNASVRLHRARVALKGRLEETCGTCATHGCLDCTCQES